MNIALLVSSMETGGAERVAATLANAWVARGDGVLLVPTYSGRGGCAYALADGVETRYLADLVTPGRGAVRRWQRLLALRRLLCERRPDVVLAFLGMVGVAAIVATRGLGLPLIVAERIDPAADRDSGRGMHWLRRWLYPLADAVVLQTDDARQSAAGMWPRVKRLQVVPNPLPPELAGRSPADHAPPGRNVLLAVGRLAGQKRFDLLIEVFARLAGDFPDWDLRILGEGPERPLLEKRVRDLGLSGRVFLPGVTARPWDEMAAAQAFVLSSAYEGFPNVLLEAMALGLPCVSFDCPSGPREMLRDGEDGLLAPAGDAAALEDGLRGLLSDGDLRRDLGARAAASVRERYALARVLDRWDDLFDAVRYGRTE